GRRVAGLAAQPEPRPNRQGRRQPGIRIGCDRKIPHLVQSGPSRQANCAGRRRIAAQADRRSRPARSLAFHRDTGAMRHDRTAVGQHRRRTTRVAIMTPSSEIILITTLAEYQTRFWIPVAQRLRSAGREVRLLAFDDRSAEMATAQGVDVVNMYRTGLAGGASTEDETAFKARIASYGLDGTNFLFSHERVTFGIRDTAALRRRFMIYANAMEAELDQLAARVQRAVVVQELGGFLSVIACFYAAKKRGIRNWFIEPSFFCGRLYYTPDSFAAPDTMATASEPISPEVRGYLDDTLRLRAIVIPQKDRHQYYAAFNKIANARNARRLVEKLWDQFALGKHQEFGHNLKHARAHAAMALGATRLKKLYRPMPETPFVYYP